MTVTPMHQRLLEEHVIDRLARGLRAFTGDEHRLLGIRDWVD